MKYDLNAMDFDPDKDGFSSAFTWEFTPEGSEYWARQYIDGITPEGQAKWDAMKLQWNEENLVEKRAQVGDNVTVVANTTRHGFGIGSVVECVDLFDWEWGHRFSDGDDFWWMKPEEYDVDRTQRYVVECYGITTICTREEAEKLAAGGVDAVYKLGDKVSVTVKVELS